MASQIISGASNPSYTNNTGKNVRLILNFLQNATVVNWAGVSAVSSGPLPKEIMLAPNQSFSAICNSYNVVIIKEDGL
jgi:hypothetical protein